MANDTEIRTPGSISQAGQHLAQRLPMPVPVSWINRLLKLEKLDALYSDARRLAQGAPLFGPLLESLGVSCAYDAAELARIPARGPVVVVANHPFGMLEGLVLCDLLLRVRPDVRLMANSLLGLIPELRQYILPVDPFGGPDAARRNVRHLRKCLEWLQAGGLLIVFPAGEVSSLRLRRMRIEDPAWNPSAARLIQRTSATAVPIFIHGANGKGFQTAGLLHPRLRTALLTRELLNKRGKTVRLTIGAPLSASRLTELPDETEATEYLRRRAHNLQWRGGGEPTAEAPKPRRADAVVPPVDPAILRQEIRALPASQRLGHAAGLETYFATADQVPQTLREIGRLREITFRAAGEGTGREIDLDRFDAHYSHLFVWSPAKSEIIGAYRLAETEPVLRRFGLRGLYTASLFHVSPKLFRQLGPAIELGRSFVRPEYQREYMPLMLLWRGIGQFVLRSPECRFLFGPVSISGDYSAASRAIIVSFLKSKRLEDKLWSHVRPRHGFRPRPLLAGDVRNLTALMTGMDDLCEIVSDIEPGGRSIPVLLRQYLNVGGRFLGFNVDKRFSGVVDGLVLVDLLQTDPKLLQRHFGKEGAQRILKYHSSGLAS